jgi:uncharacterized protein (DUF4415 family)
MAKRSASSARGARTRKNARRTPPIDYSDIPALSDGELAKMRRIGRPTLGDVARQLIAIRLDPHVLEALRKEAERRGIGYQTLINDVLARHVKRHAA